ncbi:tyrosine-type recombinase/integrase [Microlunatus ginsengisoli]|uniref:tyrosine-type recombinase/integrase n=1 Tax=Microlunatus ginsengisoli TaxID=363863 RepID=UPI0031DC4A43
MIDVGPDPQTRKRKQITRSGFRTRDDADEAMTEALAALDSGSWTNDRGIKLGEWLDDWLLDLGERKLAAKTMAGYRAHIANFWKPQLGHVRLRDLRRSHVDRALRILGRPQTTGKPKGNAGSYVEVRSAETIDSYRRTLRASLAAAVRRELITHNPAAGRIDAIPPRNVDDDDEDELGIWEPDETARFLKHVSSDRLAAMYELAAYVGLRRGELCGLRWSDIDPDGKGLRVRQTIVELSRSQARPGDLTCPVCRREHVGRHFKRPKSKAGRRWVPLAEPARQALARHKAAQREERADFGEDYLEHDLVFSAVDGDPLRPDLVTRQFNDYAGDCGLPVIRLHDLRHGACSLLISGGVPIEVVQMILGHSSPAVTRKVYAHLMKRATAGQVEAATKPFTDDAL